MRPTPCARTSPQTTTEPSAFKAAKDPFVENTLRIPPDNLSWTAEESAPASSSPQVITEPSSFNAAKALSFVNMSITPVLNSLIRFWFLLSFCFFQPVLPPPPEPWLPQVMTEPSFFNAAKAPIVENTSLTPEDNLSWTAEESAPQLLPKLMLPFQSPE